MSGITGGIWKSALIDSIEDYVDNAVASLQFSYFLTDTASDIGTYYRMQDVDTGEAESSFTASGLTAGDDQLLFSYATPLNDPLPEKLTVGSYTGHYSFERSAGDRDVQIYWKLFKRASGGAETELMESEKSGLITTKAPLDLYASLTEEKLLASDDRLVLKVYANVGSTGTDVDIKIYQEGTINSSITIRVTSDTIADLYLKKGGLSGGQVAYGGTDANDNLTIGSTTNATKGRVQIASGDVVRSLTTNYETLITDNNDLINKKYFEDNLPVPVLNILTITSDGQTAFTLSASPGDLNGFDLYLNGQRRKRGASDDYTVSGTSLTWLDPGGLTLKTTDSLIARFNDYTAGAAPKEIWFTATDYSANNDNYRARPVAGTGAFRFTFRTPDNYLNLVSCKLWGQVGTGVAGSGKNIDLSSSYGGAGEALNVHTESDTTTVYDFTGFLNQNNPIIDLSIVLTNLSAGDVVGVFVDHNTIGGTIYYTGIQLIYT